METNKRIFISAKDIQVLTGKREKAAYRIMNKIRIHYNKEKHQVITFAELYHYFGVVRAD